MNSSNYFDHTGFELDNQYQPLVLSPILLFSAADVSKTFKLLSNPKTAFIKKRQIMRISFGDYRAKMEKEEHKFKLGKAF